MRFSLRWLFGTITFAAIACCSLVYASHLIRDALGVAIFAFLTIAALGAIYSVGSRKPFWGGCAIAGLIYLASAYLPPKITTPWGVAGSALKVLHPKVAREIETNSLDRYGVIQTAFRPPLRLFSTVGQMLVAIPWTIAGGGVAHCFRAVAAREVAQ
jgi:hypothetical protein